MARYGTPPKIKLFKHLQNIYLNLQLFKYKGVGIYERYR